MARLRAVPDPRRLSADVVRELRELTSQLGVGATLPDPGVFPGAFDRAGIRRRTEPRNRLLGTTYSQPEEGIFVLGVAYHDARDGHTNEDAFIFEGATLTHTTPSELLVRFPQYDQDHWSDKPYLDDSDASI